MPTESEGSMAATSRFPVTLIASMCRGAMKPAAPINAKLFIRQATRKFGSAASMLLGHRQARLPSEEPPIHANRTVPKRLFGRIDVVRDRRAGDVAVELLAAPTHLLEEEGDVGPEQLFAF